MTFPYFLPQEPGATRRFDPVGDATGGWQPYTIAPGVKQLQILAVGGGGGGGNGFAGAAGTARGGGGGGASGAIIQLIVPTAHLPGTIFVNPGRGGLGTAGADTILGLAPQNLAAFNLVVARGGGLGGNGSATAAGAAGAAGGTTLGAMLMLGLSQLYSGSPGAAGGAHTGAAGASLTFGSPAYFITGGAGGGGATSADFAGGAINGAGLCLTSPGGAAGSFEGGAGFERWQPILSAGGGGGGAANSAAGGAGGAGGRGSGGGGGGAGTSGGTGGRGGDGFVLITAQV